MKTGETDGGKFRGKFRANGDSVLLETWNICQKLLEIDDSGKSLNRPGLKSCVGGSEGIFSRPEVAGVW